MHPSSRFPEATEKLSPRVMFPYREVRREPRESSRRCSSRIEMQLRAPGAAQTLPTQAFASFGSELAQPGRAVLSATDRAAETNHWQEAPHTAMNAMSESPFPRFSSEYRSPTLRCPTKTSAGVCVHQHTSFVRRREPRRGSRGGIDRGWRADNGAAWGGDKDGQKEWGGCGCWCGWREWSRGVGCVDDAQLHQTQRS